MPVSLLHYCDIRSPGCALSQLDLRLLHRPALNTPPLCSIFRKALTIVIVVSVSRLAGCLSRLVSWSTSHWLDGQTEDGEGTRKKIKSRPAAAAASYRVHGTQANAGASTHQRAPPACRAGLAEGEGQGARQVLFPLSRASRPFTTEQRQLRLSRDRVSYR